jgi:hypothetical protein
LTEFRGHRSALVGGLRPELESRGRTADRVVGEHAEAVVARVLFIGGQPVRIRRGIAAQLWRPSAHVRGCDRTGATLEALAALVVIETIDVSLSIQQARFGGLEGPVVFPPIAAHGLEQNGDARASDDEEHGQQKNDEDDEQ